VLECLAPKVVLAQGTPEPEVLVRQVFCIFGKKRVLLEKIHAGRFDLLIDW
jgi:hypothetical protein